MSTTTARLAYAKKLVEQGHYTLKDAALEAGLSRKTVSKWANREGWGRPAGSVGCNKSSRSGVDIAEVVRSISQAWKPFSKPIAKKTRKLQDPCLLELSLYDFHLGKYAWARETGDDYDLKIASTLFSDAVADLLDIVKPFEIDKIIFPIGHDFFHVDGFQGTTFSGTPMDSVDDRFAKVFETGLSLTINAIEAALETCPNIELLYVPGNHDRSSSFFLMHVLKAHFRKSEGVVVDVEPRLRKYRTYGPTLYGYQHGDSGSKARDRQLPLVMAAEVPRAWGQSRYRAWRQGHYHRKTRTDYIVGDTYQGVRVDVMPSLSAADAWHYQNYYVKNGPAAEAWLWSKRTGYVGQFAVRARDDRGC